MMIRGKYHARNTIPMRNAYRQPGRHDLALYQNIKRSGYHRGRRYPQQHQTPEPFRNQDAHDQLSRI